MPDIYEIDCETGEVEERSFTAEEQAQRDRDAEEAAQRQAEEDARDQKRGAAQADIDAIAEKVRAGTFDFQKDGIAALKAVLLKASR